MSVSVPHPSLPTAPGGATAVPAEATVHPRAGGAVPALRAFLVEDNPVIRDNLIETLQEMVPLQVVGTAQDEPGALAWLGDRGHACDVVIIDLFIEGGSGMSVLTAVKAQQLPYRTVVLSNYGHGEMERRCLEIGADRVFDKSSQIDDLIEYCAALKPAPAPGIERAA